MSLYYTALPASSGIGPAGVPQCGRPPAGTLPRTIPSRRRGRDPDERKEDDPALYEHAPNIWRARMHCQPLMEILHHGRSYTSFDISRLNPASDWDSVTDTVSQFRLPAPCREDPGTHHHTSNQAPSEVLTAVSCEGPPAHLCDAKSFPTRQLPDMVSGQTPVNAELRGYAGKLYR